MSCRFSNDLERTIADVECNSYQWTLMHRYHKAADIINEVGQLLLQHFTAKRVAAAAKAADASADLQHMNRVMQ